jgi:hypothetical protein
MWIADRTVHSISVEAEQGNPAMSSPGSAWRSLSERKSGVPAADGCGR